MQSRYGYEVYEHGELKRAPTLIPGTEHYEHDWEGFQKYVLGRFGFELSNTHKPRTCNCGVGAAEESRIFRQLAREEGA